jgi:Abortive infection alpha
LGLLLKDNISFWRFKNQVNTVLKARAFLEQKGIQPEAIKANLLPEMIVPLIEAARESSDETLSDMFAGLLASAINPGTQDTVHPAYSKVVNQL